MYIPIASEDQSSCILHTKKLELIVEGGGDGGVPKNLNCTGNGELCLAVLATASVVSLSTFIVSGSIVLVGNTFHWLEKEGSCDGGFIRIKIDEFYQLLGVDQSSV